MKDQMPRQEDDLEIILTKNVIHVLAGHTAELAIAVITKVLQPLIIGAAPTKGVAIRMVNRIARHLKDEIYKQPDHTFGFLDKSESNDPIVHERHMGVKKE